MSCECDLRARRWNPASGRCETCGSNLPTAEEQIVRLSPRDPRDETIARLTAEVERLTRTRAEKERYRDVAAAADARERLVSGEFDSLKRENEKLRADLAAAQRVVEAAKTALRDTVATLDGYRGGPGMSTTLIGMAKARVSAALDAISRSEGPVKP